MSFRDLLAAFPVVLAPMEDVSDAPYRALCRQYGASLCVTEFVRAESLINRTSLARRKAHLAADDRPTGIQIHGADAGLLLEAARIAEERAPAFIDINCGCWVPRVASRGAGAAWLREPEAMVAMAAAVVRAVATPVTVKTRIGWGPESHMPIVELARRLEDVGVAALTVHCRTAQMGHSGAADWRWAARAQAAVRMPVIVNGDVITGADCVRALAETGCAGVMIGRAAITAPWVFREARAALAGQPAPPPVTLAERLACYQALAARNVSARGERPGVEVTRRHLGILGPLAPVLRSTVVSAPTLAELTARLSLAAGEL